MPGVSIEALHRTEGLNLYRFLLRLLGNPSDAADAAQETYLRLVRALSRTEIEQPSVFLFFVARNVAASMGKRRRFEAQLFAPLMEADWNQVLDGRARTEQQIIARQQLRLVADAVDLLPPRCREVFMLSAFDGLANGEIAVRLGISRNMVEKHLMKALLHTRRSCRDFF